MAGMDPMRFLETEDTVERITMAKIADRWYEEREKLDRNLAVFIIENLQKGFKK